MRKNKIKYSCFFKLILVSFILNALISCSIPENSEKEYFTQTGKGILIKETHPLGQSLSTIRIETFDFNINLHETLHDKDPVNKVLIADLDQNGFDEIYIITISSGSGSYGNVLGFASNNDNSLSMIYMPEIEVGDRIFSGYRGHDQFQIENNKLIRFFPVYMPGDTHHSSAGVKRKIIYGLHPGEAMWQLKIEKVEEDN